MKKNEMDKIATALQKRIGKKITALRKEMGYTSHERFAYDHGFSRETYRRLEAGKGNWTMRTVASILIAFDLSLEEFFIVLFEESRITKQLPKK